MEIKNLHIIPKDKFDEAFIKFVNKNFVNNEHFFLVISGKNSYKNEYKNIKNVHVHLNHLAENKILKILTRIVDIIKTFYCYYYYCSRAQKVIFHSIDTRIIIFLYFFRNILRKTYWGIWGIGGDKKRKRIFNKILERMKLTVCGNFKGYITHIKGDYEIIKQRTNCKGKYYNCFIYPSNLYKEISLKEYKKEELFIQVGNSAQDCNNHLEIFEKLKIYKDEKIKIFCILSYGDEGNKDNIIKKGEEIFGDKFVPVVDFMKFDEYMEFLSKIDIAIFAHDVQKAVGNITSLLSMKKTIYLKESVTTYDMLKDLGVKVKSFDKFEKLEKFDDEILEKNKEIIKERFSEKRLKEDLNIIFNS